MARSESNSRILDGEIITTRFDDWRAYEGVRTRRVIAFLVDYLLIGLLLIPVALFVFLLGLVTGCGSFSFGIVNLVCAVDAYLLAERRAKGEALGPWQFF